MTGSAYELQSIEEKLTEALGVELALYTSGKNASLHPRARFFLHEEPYSSFRGLSQTPLLEVELSLEDADEYTLMRLEREDRFILFSRIDKRGSRGDTYYVSGELLECERSSPDEHAFIQAAVAEVLERAAAPFKQVFQSVRNSALVSQEELLAVLARVTATA